MRNYEFETLKNFKNFLGEKFGDYPGEMTREVSVGTKRFDALMAIGDKVFAIEVKRVLGNQEEVERSARWGNTVKAIRDELQGYLSHHKRFPWVGLWCVETSESFGVYRTLVSRFAREYTPKIVEAISDGLESVRIGDFVLRLERITNRGEGDIFFSTSGRVGAIDPASTIEVRFRASLPAAHEQLNTDLGVRVLILANNYSLGRVGSFVEALSRIKEVWQWGNFDKIYLEDIPKHFILVFDRELRNAWNGEKFAATDDFLQIFQLWITYLRKMDPKRTLEIVRFIVGDKEPSAILPNTFAREEIVEMGNYFIEKGKLDDARWIMERFINDPDPVRDGRDFDFDKKIRDGEDPHIITSVRGKLAWVIQKLALRKDTITEAFEYAKRLLKYKPETNRVGEDNLYVIQQAIVPLVEITSRRVWLQEIDKRKGSELHSKLLATLFALLRNKNLYDPREKNIYPPVAKYLLDAFSYYRDLNEKQAKEVLDSLEHIDESALLFIYFAIYRKKHFGGNFKSKKPVDFENLLEDKIRNGRKNLCRKIAWQFWRIVDDDVKQVKNLERYITILSKSPYDQQVFGNLDQLIEVVIKKRKYAKIAAEWFENALKRRLEWTKKKVGEDKNFGDWMHYDAIFEGIAKWRSPKQFVDLLETAVEIAETGQVYFYDVKKCFEASKNNPKLDGKKEKLDDLWERVKKIYPRADNHWHD